MLLPTFLALASFLLLFCSYAGAQSIPAYSEEQMLCAVNAERVKAGLAPLGADPRLTTAAKLHAEDMSKKNSFDDSELKDRLKQATFPAIASAENIAFGQTTVVLAMKAFMSSEIHKKNILNPAMTMFGSARSEGTENKRLWYVQVLAAEANKPASNVPTCEAFKAAEQTPAAPDTPIKATGKAPNDVINKPANTATTAPAGTGAATGNPDDKDEVRFEWRWTPGKLDILNAPNEVQKKLLDVLKEYEDEDGDGDGEDAAPDA